MEPVAVPEEALITGPSSGANDIPTVELWDDRAESRLAWWVRMNLALVGAGLIVVMTIAACLHPYDAQGAPKTQETHRQLGLPPCSFYVMTGLPCPSCGFTTSFSLLAHLDPVNSLRANSVGTLLAVFCFLAMPWALWSAWRGRYLWVRSAERVVITSLIVFVVLMLTRWGIILGLAKLEGRI